MVICLKRFFLLEKILLAWKDQPTSAPLLAQPCEVDQHMRNALSGKYFPGNRFFGLSFLRTFWEILANLVRWSWLFLKILNLLRSCFKAEDSQDLRKRCRVYVESRPFASDKLVDQDFKWARVLRSAQGNVLQSTKHQAPSAIAATWCQAQSDDGSTTRWNSTHIPA